MKNKTLKKHFLKPENMGTIEKPSHEAIIKSDVCNDIVKLMALIDNKGIIIDIKAQVFGCGYSIAGASILTTAARGNLADDVPDLFGELTKDIIPEIPERHASCVNLAQKAFQIILKKYQE